MFLQIPRGLKAVTKGGASPLAIAADQKVRTPADVPAALASLATAIGDGIITIEEATAAGSLLQTFLETYETAHATPANWGLTDESPENPVRV